MSGLRASRSASDRPGFAPSRRSSVGSLWTVSIESIMVLVYHPPARLGR